MYTIRGTLRGELWWPIGAPAERYVEATFDASDRADGLRALVESVIDHEAGDFSNAPVFLADATLIVERGGKERSFDLAGMPSLEGYTSAEYPEFGEDF